MPTELSLLSLSESELDSASGELLISESFWLAIVSDRTRDVSLISTCVSYKEQPINLFIGSGCEMRFGVMKNAFSRQLKVERGVGWVTGLNFEIFEFLTK